MASTQRPSQAERVALNAWLWAYGGCIFADAPNAVTSAVAIAHRISMHRSITPLRVTRSSQASSRTRDGFTTIVRRNSSTVRSFTLRTRIRPINPCRDRPERCLQTGKRSFTNRGRLFGAAATHPARTQRHKTRLTMSCAPRRFWPLKSCPAIAHRAIKHEWQHRNLLPLHGLQSIGIEAQGLDVEQRDCSRSAA